LIITYIRTNYIKRREIKEKIKNKNKREKRNKLNNYKLSRKDCFAR